MWREHHLGPELPDRGDGLARPKPLALYVFTDSMELYGSRLKEMEKEMGKYTRENALVDFERRLLGCTTDYMKELTYTDRKAIHNLKYYTWVEQQGKTYEEICAQWNPEYWRELFEDEVAHFEKLIADFNREIGL